MCAARKIVGETHLLHLMNGGNLPLLLSYSVPLFPSPKCLQKTLRVAMDVLHQPRMPVEQLQRVGPVEDGRHHHVGGRGGEVSN
jgi:hypothetical protein